ncbi:hypothetical protein FB451DRAFT_1406441 [Mycena latifolia]|nr:hypothetical protein FB451DRAFT_1406441 [Mycena latifolia]
MIPHRQPHGQRVALAFVVRPAAFVASPHCATGLASVPPAPLGGRACRALQDHPQHAPRPQRAPRAFLIAGAAFVAFSCATTEARSWAQPQHDTDVPSTCGSRSTAHASPRSLAILRTRRPTVCSKPGPVARRECGAHHRQRAQHTLQLFPFAHAAFVPSPRAPTVCSIGPPSPLDSPTLAATRPRRVYGRTETTRSRRSSRSYAVRRN